MFHQFRLNQFRVSIISAALLAAAGATTGAGAAPISTPIASKATAFAVSKPVRELAAVAGNRAVTTHPRINPLAGEPDHGQRGTWTRGQVPLDPLVSVGLSPATPTPKLKLEFDGLANPDACGGCSPPDTNGD